MKSDLEHSRRTQSLQLTAHSLQIFGMPFLNPTEIGLRELHRIKLAIYRGREASGKAVPEKGGCLAASQPLGESGHKLNSVTEAPNLAPGLEYPSSAALGRRQPHPPGPVTRLGADHSRSSQLWCGQPTRCEGWGRGAWGHPFPN